MRRPLAALLLNVLVAAVAVTSLAGCGDESTTAEPKVPRNTAGTNVGENVATATQYFAAVASNDPAHVEAAYGLAAPASPALSYLKLVHDGLSGTGAADQVTVVKGRYRICKAASPRSCHTYSQVVLTDGKINDFTIDGKKIRIR